MGFKADKSITYTKSKFETFLNSEDSNEWWDKLDKEQKLAIDQFPNSKFRNKLGTVFRNNYAVAFSREYMIWLNTK